jgi:hypothetical protein
MENQVIIEDFGPRVTSVWNACGPPPADLVERARRAPSARSAGDVAKTSPYDPRRSRTESIAGALDERAADATAATADDPSRKARRLADACANMLTERTQSAEVFAQLDSAGPRAPGLSRN